jgi:hypothetical protein
MERAVRCEQFQRELLGNGPAQKFLRCEISIEPAPRLCRGAGSAPYFFTNGHLDSDSGWNACSAGITALTV